MLKKSQLFFLKRVTMMENRDAFRGGITHGIFTGYYNGYYSGVYATNYGRYSGRKLLRKSAFKASALNALFMFVDV